MRPARKHPLSFRWPLWVAGALSLLFAVCELAGLRDNTAALTGVSIPSVGELMKGLLYVVAHLGFVFVAPVLVLAAGLVMGLKGIAAWRAGRSRARAGGGAD